MSRIEIESLSEEDLRNKKKGGGIYDAVNPNVTTPIAPELDDLIRLHFLVRSRRVTTILEFGVGVSTWVLDHALQLRNNVHHLLYL